MQKYVRTTVRFFIIWFINTISILVTAWIIPGINLVPQQDVSQFVLATTAALVLGIVNLLIRPLILLIALPFGWMIIFAVGFFIDAMVLMITAALLPGFQVDSFWLAFLGGLFFAFVNTVMITLLDIDNDDTFYENLVIRQAVKRAGKVSPQEGRGLLMLEIDGLSYYHLQKALDDGYMPTVKKMIDEGGYKISQADCGLPSTTPACQAGIMLGNNDNIPGFRWLDKENNRMLAGGSAAAEIEPILSNGQGLLRGGSSIANMFSGDAEKSLLTFSKIKAGTEEDKKKRAQDMFFLLRNPYFFTRVLVLYFADVFQEVWQGWQQRRKDVQPRLNRLHNGYPFLRAATNVFLRDVGAYFTILDIVRGAPAIYTLFAGYDEVAHHSGPWTQDAMLTLRQVDTVIARFLKTIEEKAPRPYEFIMLSDHGQSFGPTFKQRYGFSILEFIQEHLPSGTTTLATNSGDDGSIPVSAMMSELENIEDQDVSGGLGHNLINRAQNAIKNPMEQRQGTKEEEPAKVTLCYGGNMASVYFDLQPRKLALSELNKAYPGMVDALVQHEGVGFVVAYQDDWDPVAFGKQGARNLHTGDVVGEDPLQPYGDVELRSWQVRRLADFPNSGDLIINSVVYADGSVAALEELIGNHGGLGGEQTDAFIFHPGDMEVPKTRNSQDVMAILDARRGLPGSSYKPLRPVEPVIDPWIPGNLWKGLTQVGKWIGLAVQASTLNREGYRSIARDAYMTAPALLIGTLMQVIQSVSNLGHFDITDILVRFVAWFVSVFFLFLAARVLRGKHNYTTTLRVAGFALTPHVLELLVFIPVVGSIARFLAVVVSFVGVWLGTATAQELKGWRTILLPVIYLLVIVTSGAFMVAALKGTVVTVAGLLASLGIVSP